MAVLPEARGALEAKQVDWSRTGFFCDEGDEGDDLHDAAKVKEATRVLVDQTERQFEVNFSEACVAVGETVI